MTEVLAPSLEFDPQAPGLDDFVIAEAGLSFWIERGFNRQGIAERMLAAAPSLRIYGTPEQPILDTPSIAYPSLTEEGGIDSLNELIEQYGVDAIWPHRSAVHDLSGLACEVHAAGTPDVIKLVDDKGKFFEWLGNDPHRADMAEVVGAAGVAEEYARRHAEGKEVCVKPVVGVHSHGYWHLTEQDPGSLLKDPAKREMHPDIYLAAMELQEREKGPERLIVMDYLPGPEVSVDLLCWRGMSLIHAARVKDDFSPLQRVQSEHPILNHARDVAERLAMHGIVSMQYRLNQDGEWKMLEVNPRPAGGSIKSEDAGFGIISNWAKLVAHETEPDEVFQHEGDVSVVDKRIIVVEANH